MKQPELFDRGRGPIEVQPAIDPQGDQGAAVTPPADYVAPYPDGLPGHAAFNDASLGAAVAIYRKCGKLQQRVFRCIRESGSDGLTAQQVADRLGIANVYTVAPRITELVKLGLVEDSGRQRVVEPRCPNCGAKLRRARPATVWTALA